MYSGWGKKEEEEPEEASILSEHRDKVGAGILLFVIFGVLLAIFVLWLMHGYHYVIVPQSAPSFEAVNASL